MKIKETLRRDAETLKRLEGKKEKAQFIWDYYKIPIVAILLAVCLTAVAVYESVSRQPVIMYAVLVNTDAAVTERDDGVFDRLLAEGGIETAGRSTDVEASLTFRHGADGEGDAATLQVLNALFGISDLDFFASDEDTFMIFAEENAFADLGKLIEPDWLSENTADLIHVTDSNGEDTVCGIRLRGGSALHEAGYYSEDVIVGVAVLAENMEEAFTFLRMLIGA